MLNSGPQRNQRWVTAGWTFGRLFRRLSEQSDAPGDRRSGQVDAGCGRGAVSVSDSRPLLRAKLRVPSASSSTVVRSRLHDRLGTAAYPPLTTVVAPAGWGKSTLLAAWACDPEWQGRVGWLSLDEADDEPVRFWTYAVSALEAVAPDLARESLAAGLCVAAVALGLLLAAVASLRAGVR